MKLNHWIATLALGLASFSQVAAAQPAKHEVTQVAATVSFAFLPVYVAEQMGYFREEGVNMKSMTAQSAQAALAAVTTGAAHYYLSTPVAAARSAAQGAPLTNCGSLMNQNPTNIVLSGATAKKFNLPADPSKLSIEARVKMLQGLRLAAHTAGSSPDQTLRFMLRQAGMDPEKDVQILPIAGSPILAALQQGRIDGFAFSSPLADTAVQKQGAYKLISLARGDYKPLADMVSISMVCSKDWVEKDTEAAAATMRAITRAMKLMKDNPQAAKAAAKKAFPNLEDEIFNAAFADNLAAFPASPLVLREQMERALDFHHKTGGTPLNVDVAATFSNRAVERALQTLR